MCDTDIAARRKRVIFSATTAAPPSAARKGLCLKCGKRPPAPHRTQCEPCIERQRARDLARYHRRTAERIAQGLCPKCGKRPPAPERSQCGPCLDKDAAAGRARDARLRAAGIPRRDPERATAYERERRHRQIAERRAAGLCPECGDAPPAPGRTVCGPCGEERRTKARARYARGKAAGKLYGGRNVETRRRIGREKSARRLAARLAAGLCTSCGKGPPAADGTTCEPCREARRAFERDRYAERRAAGLCGYCGGPTLDGGSRCGPCAVRESERRDPEKRNAAARRLYAKRRAAGLCTDCGEPSHGAARCEPCARRSYERSTYFRGMPLYPPQYTVVELTTGEDHGTFDSWDEVAMCLAFARLSLDQVEVLTDQSPMATFSAWA